MSEIKAEKIATVLVAAFKKKAGGALLFATTQIAQCLNSDDSNGAAMWQKVGTNIVKLEMKNQNANDACQPSTT